MAIISMLAAAKRNRDGTFDAEVAISLYDSGSSDKPTSSTRQRTVGKGFSTRAAAEIRAEDWIRDNLYPVVMALPEAKP